MTRHRTDGQVVTSAAQIDDALERGLSEDELVALVAARHAWRILGRVDRTTISSDLRSALTHPAATGWDTIFVRRARAELSDLLPSVTL